MCRSAHQSVRWSDLHQPDSPIGLAAWLLGHPGFEQWTSIGSDSEKSPTKDELLDNITLYWLTNSAVSSAQLYWENGSTSLLNAIVQKTDEISPPVAAPCDRKTVPLSPCR